MNPPKMKSKLVLWLALVLSAILWPLVSSAGIVYPQAPAAGEKAALKYRLGVFDGFFRSFGISTDGLTFGRPFGVYVYRGTLTNLLSGQLLSLADQYAWRYPVMQGTNDMGAIDLKSDQTPGKYLTYAEGSFPSQRHYDDPTVEALRAAERFPRVQRQDYEFRYLNMEPEHFTAVWLHGQTDDILIPLPPTYGRMNAWQPYSAKQIAAILGPEAQKESAMWAKLFSQQKKLNQP